MMPMKNPSVEKFLLQPVLLVVLALMSFACNPEVNFTSSVKAVKKHLDDCLLPNSCLLEYNSALAADNSCCLALGSENTCDVNIECNELSGENCCLIYATEHTDIGATCCRYADGSTPYGGEGADISQACNVLLGFEGASASAQFCEQVLDEDLPTKAETEESDCLIEYNSALVDEGADPCCFRNGINYCDLSVSCNEQSGEDCCLFYATDHTLGGQGCCLYSDGSTGTTAEGEDRTQECAALLYL
jgi:hypothetical protein